MRVCPSCAEENPDKAKFCLECATSLVEAPTPGEERKTVTVLFCDLVGFTARSDQADPEEVRATIAPYHRMLRSEIERFGGTVEKFIGDAVMAVFGAPVAHEDDAERAIRAGLRILEVLGADGDDALSVRIGINTGEAVVTLGARAEQGEAIVTGDVVNTASRLQGAAPVDAIVVGEATFDATAHLFEFEALDAVTVKGKSDPLPIWRPLAARSRFGVDLHDTDTTAFVGREDELAMLTGALRRATRAESCQLVTIVGEPGVGKSRLVAELLRHVDELDELISWRQGRCLPYGEGITFWALGEIVKAHCGILESDGPAEAVQKLEIALGPILEEDDRPWVSARLKPLVGIETDNSGEVAQTELFQAWRSFVEAVAVTGPLVLVFEDLHWADEALLGFIEHLGEFSLTAPIVVVCTARPELFERHAEWGAGQRNAATVSLPPLTETETSVLIAGLLSNAVLPAEIHEVVLERSGGNPLYAEEFVRMLKDRGLLERSGRSWTLTADREIPLPATVQALIAARIDTLAPDRKALLHDASVIGKVFWPGAVAAIGSTDEQQVRDGLHELARKELIRPSRASSVRDQPEYAFRHLLVRDVAYSQIPKASRGAKHLAAAAWIEEMSGERSIDHAEVLAHHYVEALHLGGEGVDEDSIRSRAASFMRFAAKRATTVDAA
ncbi:MAG: AAA family ATPase, partial [Gaiellaceae bacterium]